MRNHGLGQGRQWLVVASGCQEREIRRCSSPMTASRDAAVPMRLPLSSNARCPRSGFVLPARACNRLMWAVRGRRCPALAGKPEESPPGNRRPCGEAPNHPVRVRGFGAARIYDAAGAVLAEWAGQHDSHRLISRPGPAGSSDARRGLARAAACMPWIRDQSTVSGGWEYVPAGRDAHLVPTVCRPLTEVGRIRIQNGCCTAVTQGYTPRRLKLRLKRWMSASASTTSARPLTSTLHRTGSAHLMAPWSTSHCSGPLDLRVRGSGCRTVHPF
jgi:hypothetical protein